MNTLSSGRLSLSTVMAAVALLVPSQTAMAGTKSERSSSIETNDNRSAAGAWRDGAWHVALRAARGDWLPEGANGPRLEVEAFGEVTGLLQVPAPLIRVREGTEIVTSVRNDLDAPLRVHGLCARDGSRCASIEVPPRSSREVRFVAGLPGTYHYWATTTGMPLAFRGAADSQLSGAFIVDPAEGSEADRVLVITEWTSLTLTELTNIATQPDPGAAFLRLKPTVLFTLNGRSWPHTELLTYDRGDEVRWRVINLSTQSHPMHLHGFYFEVTSHGDGLRDNEVSGDRRVRMVTRLMPSGTTMAMTWTPERIGNWLFHCHTMVHVSPMLHVDGSPRMSHDSSHDNHRGMGMTGLVLGVQVRDRDTKLPEPPMDTSKARQLSLILQSERNGFGNAPSFGFVLKEGRQLSDGGRVQAPGPTLVLRRGEPVEITLVNQLAEATSIHWHGMELESYYDGVHGWSGTVGRVAPSLQPGGTFLVRFAPPRAGTFIYHTHLHDNRQLTSGLYGPLLVVEPDEIFDERVDHVFVAGRAGPDLNAPVVINGQQAPLYVWKAGTRHRVRLINITPNDTVEVSLRTNAGLVAWRQLSKDGATLSMEHSTPVAASQLIGVGETYDFEVDLPAGRRSFWLEVRSSGGKWLAQGQVIVQ